MRYIAYKLHVLHVQKPKTRSFIGLFSILTCILLCIYLYPRNICCNSFTWTKCDKLLYKDNYLYLPLSFRRVHYVQQYRNTGKSESIKQRKSAYKISTNAFVRMKYFGTLLFHFDMLLHAMCSYQLDTRSNRNKRKQRNSDETIRTRLSSLLKVILQIYHLVWCGWQLLDLTPQEQFRI